MYLHNCNCKIVKSVLPVWLAPPACSLLSQQTSADQVTLSAHTAQESHGLPPCVKCGGPSLESSNLLSVNHLGHWAINDSEITFLSRTVSDEKYPKKAFEEIRLREEYSTKYK